MKRRALLAYLGINALLGLYWWSLEAGDEPAPQEVAIEVAEEQPSNEAAVSQVPEAEAEQADKVLPEESAEEPAPLAYNPPFPERVDLFQAPKRQGRGLANMGGQTQIAVELLGFVNVEGQRVALSIDGMVSTAAEGDTLSGIEVISIQPPKVVLQRGRQRWQASFDN